MAGLDDARMHGTNGDLVHALAVDAHEGIDIDTGLVNGQARRRIEERMEVRGPGVVTQPRARMAASQRLAA